MHSPAHLINEQPRTSSPPPGGRPLDRRLPVRRLVRHLRILPRAFEALAARHPDKTFVWIDIEDQADVVGDLDVDNFPTLLLQHHDTVAFFGTMLPDAALADRLVQAQSAQSDAELSELIINSEERAQWQRECNLRALLRDALA
jgi:thioredoxin 1